MPRKAAGKITKHIWLRSRMRSRKIFSGDFKIMTKKSFVKMHKNAYSTKMRYHPNFLLQQDSGQRVPGRHSLWLVDWGNWPQQALFCIFVLTVQNRTLNSHINLSPLSFPREGSWYWTHSLEPMDFSDWYPGQPTWYFTFYISHFTFNASWTIIRYPSEPTWYLSKF